MSRFFDRFLPIHERRAALWLGLGAAAVTWCAQQLAGLVRDAVPVGTKVGAAPVWAPGVIAVAVEFAAVALLVAALIRVARAPKALALFLVLSALLGVAFWVLWIPLGYLEARASWAASGLAGEVDMPQQWFPSAIRLAEPVALGLGAMAGAWIAATVTLARIRDAGFSGDEPNGSGLSTNPERIGWGFLGWEGRPATGASLIAVAFVQLRLVVMAISLGISAVMLLVPNRYSGDAVANAATVGSSVVLAAGYLFAARAVTRRTGIASLWLIPLGALLTSAAWVIESAIIMYRPAWSEVLSELGGSALLNLSGPLLVVAATLAGTELALRARPATIPSDEAREPASPTPHDTQETTDE